MGEMVRLNEAAKQLGISENTLRKRIRDEGVVVYVNPQDNREKLVDLEELREAVMQPRPTSIGRVQRDNGGKAAAA